MADIQVYQEQPFIFDQSRVTELNRNLDPRLVSERKSGGGKVKYIQGHNAIDQANRIFGYGNWGWRVVSVEQVILEDPLAHEAVGIEYRAVVEVTIRGSVPISDVGSQPVSTWNVEDQIMQRRLKTANYNKTPVDEGPFTMIEKREARAVIVDAHEAAKKGCVTDALKRALRGYGSQFGNSLYGDGHVDLGGGNAVEAVNVERYVAMANEHVPGGWSAVRKEVIEGARVIGDLTDEQILIEYMSEVKAIFTRVAQEKKATKPQQTVESEPPATEAQWASIRKLCERLEISVLEGPYTSEQAKTVIAEMSAEYRAQRSKQTVGA